MYYIDTSRATMDAADLGHPAHLPAGRTVGEVVLPARGVLATSQAMWEILEPAVGYDRTRSQTATAAWRLNGGG
jgi:hypothetical protein